MKEPITIKLSEEDAHILLMVTSGGMAMSAAPDERRWKMVRDELRQRFEMMERVVEDVEQQVAQQDPATAVVLAMKETFLAGLRSDATRSANKEPL